MVRALRAATGALLAIRAPAEWGLCLERWKKGAPQPQPAALHNLAEGETLAGALRRLVWLLLAKRMALRRIGLQAAPLAIRPSGRAVLLDVAVSWGPFAVPALSAAGQHHLTLCRCVGREQAAAVAARLQARAGRWLQLAREVCLCRTARKLDGMQRLIRVLREGILQEKLDFEPDSRGLHVSL